MFIPLLPQFQSTGTYGMLPVQWTGAAAVDADAGYWAKAPVGSVYTRKVAAGHYQRCTKVKNNLTPSDWYIEGVIREDIATADWTDSGGATGTYTLPQTIPDKSWVERCFLFNLVCTDTAGSDVSTVTITVGTTSGSTDVDKYMTGTPSIAPAASADVVDLGIPSAPAVNVASDIKVIVTEADDFTDIEVLTMTVELRYIGLGT